MAESEDKSPIEQAVEQALDLFLYAPLGLALVARDNLPGLVERGRTQVNQQVMLARMMGQFAVQQGEKELRKRLESVAPRPPAPPARPAPAPSTNGQAAASGVNGSAAAPAAAPAPPPSAAHLAIPAYDTLSASQVVQRLAGLAREELEAVREYEAATRGRRTILTKIGQLQTESS